jgi:hypothetical protein
MSQQMTEVAMIETINIVTTATRCSCGCAVSIIVDDGPMPYYTALCAECRDAGSYAHVIGGGATMDEALWDWQEAHDKAWQVEWCLADPPDVALARQVNEEAERQRGWVVHPIATGREYILHGGHASPRYWRPASVEPDA